MKSPGCLATPVQQRCEQNGEPSRLCPFSRMLLRRSVTLRGSPSHKFHSFIHSFCRTLLWVSCVHSGRDVTVSPPRWHRQSLAAAKFGFLAAQAMRYLSLASVMPVTVVWGAAAPGSVWRPAGYAVQQSTALCVGRTLLKIYSLSLGDRAPVDTLSLVDLYVA